MTPTREHTPGPRAVNGHEWEWLRRERLEGSAIVFERWVVCVHCGARWQTVWGSVCETVEVIP